MFQVIHPLYKKVTLACIACLCFEIGVCPWPDLSALFQYTSPTPVVSLHLIPRIQYHPGIPVTLRTGSSSTQKKSSRIRQTPLQKIVDRVGNKRVKTSAIHHSCTFIMTRSNRRKNRKRVKKLIKKLRDDCFNLEKHYKEKITKLHI